MKYKQPYFLGNTCNYPQCDGSYLVYTAFTEGSELRVAVDYFDSVARKWENHKDSEVFMFERFESEGNQYTIALDHNGVKEVRSFYRVSEACRFLQRVLPTFVFPECTNSESMLNFLSSHHRKDGKFIGSDGNYHSFYVELSME